MGICPVAETQFAETQFAESEERFAELFLANWAWY